MVEAPMSRWSACMTITAPFWVAQRQIKIESVNDTTLRLVGPQIPTYEISARPADESSGWVAALWQPGGGEAVSTLIQEDESRRAEQADAWQAAFELYRRHVIT
jgi:hypothetical protein